VAAPVTLPFIGFVLGDAHALYVDGSLLYRETETSTWKGTYGDL